MNQSITKESEFHQLRIAGKLIESPGSGYLIDEISQKEGESYENAVKRIVKQLPQNEKVKLRSNVNWVLDHEAHDKHPGEYK